MYESQSAAAVKCSKDVFGGINSITSAGKIFGNRIDTEQGQGQYTCWEEFFMGVKMEYCSTCIVMVFLCQHSLSHLE